MQRYVVGFLFSESLEEVLLITKNKPAWQAGLLNGIGGKIEEGEGPHDAMVREFKEGAGLDIENWYNTIVMSGPRYELHVFRAISDKIYEAESLTDEEVGIFYANINEGIIQNLRWLIPIQLDPNLCYPIEITSAR